MYAKKNIVHTMNLAVMQRIRILKHFFGWSLPLRYAVVFHCIQHHLQDKSSVSIQSTQHMDGPGRDECTRASFGDLSTLLYFFFWFSTLFSFCFLMSQLLNWSSAI